MRVHQRPRIHIPSLLLGAVVVCLLAFDRPVDGDDTGRSDPGRVSYAPNRIVFKLVEPEVDEEGPVPPGRGMQDWRLRALVQRNRLVETDRLFRAVNPEPLGGIHLAHLPPGTSVEEAIDRLRNDPDVEWAEPDYYRYTSYTEPNDALYGTEAHLNRIDAQTAWDRTTGDPNIIVAIIDTGVSYNHEDLFDNIWVNPGEVPDRNGDGRIDLHDLDLNGNRNVSPREISTASNGLDDDGNGYTDDIMGWDFVDETVLDYVRPGEDCRVKDNNPDDFEGHGTLVAGTIAAVGNNGIGVAGVTWRSKIMILRAGYAITTLDGHSGNVPATFVCQAVRYAAEMGADIINISSGGHDACSYERTSFDYAADRGCIVVASAGNKNTSRPHYPSSYEGIVCVAATSDLDDGRADFSNYGLGVDLAAPGLNVQTTSVDDGYEGANGTSFASPIVAGVAALVKSAHPAWDRSQVISQLMVAADDITQQNPSLVGMLGAGRVNARRAVDREFRGPHVKLASRIVQYIGDECAAGHPKAELYATIRNFGYPWGRITATLKCVDPRVTIQADRDTVSYGMVANQRRVTNTSDPYILCIDPDISPKYDAAFVLDIYVNGILLASEPFEVVLHPFSSASVANRPDVVLAHGEITTDRNVLLAEWSGPPGQTSMFACTYGVGRAPGQADVIDWRYAGASLMAQEVACVPLVPDQPYYVTVKARYVLNNTTYLGFSAPVTYVAVRQEGALRLSSGVYCASDVVQIRLADLGLQGAGASHVEAATDGGDRETIALSECDTLGIFDGAVATSDDDAIAGDGILQVRHGDTIDVTYEDSDGGTGHPIAVTRFARIDCRPPVISRVDVTTTSETKATVVFDTDEPACGTVHYGWTADALDRTAIGVWDACHFTVDLVDLERDSTYVFAVEVSDEAGNRAIDDNRGRGYPFRTAAVDTGDKP